MLYVGIDPGESWCGVALMEFTPDGKCVQMDARTYSVKPRGGYIAMAHHLMDVLPHVKPTTIAIEDFRVRKVGHNQFASADTLRLIGALEYAISDVSSFSSALIPADDPKQSFKLIGPTLSHYHALWPHNRDGKWQHALSAWRVLGLYLMRKERKLLTSLHRIKRRDMRRAHRWIPVGSHADDLVAPPMRWRVRRG